MQWECQNEVEMAQTDMQAFKHLKFQIPHHAKSFDDLASNDNSKRPGTPSSVIKIRK